MLLIIRTANIAIEAIANRERLARLALFLRLQNYNSIGLLTHTFCRATDIECEIFVHSIKFGIQNHNNGRIDSKHPAISAQVGKLP